MLGWDQCQARTWDAVCRHTTSSALVQLRQAAIRNALCGRLIGLPPATTAAATGTSHSVAGTARLARLAADWAAWLLTPAQLAFRLRWSPGAGGTRAPPGGTTMPPAWLRQPEPRRPDGSDSM